MKKAEVIASEIRAWSFDSTHEERVDWKLNRDPLVLKSKKIMRNVKFTIYFIVSISYFILMDLVKVNFMISTLAVAFLIFFVTLTIIPKVYEFIANKIL